jgi:hypothetical protein
VGVKVGFNQSPLPLSNPFALVTHSSSQSSLPDNSTPPKKWKLSVERFLSLHYVHLSGHVLPSIRIRVLSLSSR